MDSNPSAQRQAERRVIVYMPDALHEALERHAKTQNSEGYSVSKVVRAACREYLRRRPQK